MVYSGCGTEYLGKSCLLGVLADIGLLHFLKDDDLAVGGVLGVCRPVDGTGASTRYGGDGGIHSGVVTGIGTGRRRWRVGL